ncbi:hypothetical protein AAHA92_07340 [Salvia divinorum]|uniref:Uncharacterized protein n=1 Tax=Salvia divinorum TaxID=28513 RepID=A0ABD1ICN3_SALDI
MGRLASHPPPRRRRRLRLLLLRRLIFSLSFKIFDSEAVKPPTTMAYWLGKLKSLSLSRLKFLSRLKIIIVGAYQSSIVCDRLTKTGQPPLREEK